MKDTICALIKDDIHHTLLMQRLELAGFDTLNYTLHLSDSIFSLMGLDDIPELDELSRSYFDLVKKYNASGDDNLNDFVNTIFLYLKGFSGHNCASKDS